MHSICTGFIQEPRLPRKETLLETYNFPLQRERCIYIWRLQVSVLVLCRTLFPRSGQNSHTPSSSQGRLTSVLPLRVHTQKQSTLTETPTEQCKCPFHDSRAGADDGPPAIAIYTSVFAPHHLSHGAQWRESTVKRFNLLAHDLPGSTLSVILSTDDRPSRNKDEGAADYVQVSCTP